MRAVLVTGASSGIGYAAALELQRGGFAVYAGVRNDGDAAHLRALGDAVHPLTLDVTKPDEIAKAAERIRADALPLQAVICNAGIALGGPLEFMPLDRLRYQLEVNLVGQLAVVQAMLPSLRESRGRLVFIGSIAGRIAPPFIGPYAASKAALAALTDALRIELASSGSGVTVSLFEFGDVKTPIWEKGRTSLDRLEQQASPEQQRYYGNILDPMRNSLKNGGERGMDVAIAAHAICTAAVGARPRDRYLLGASAKIGALVALLPVHTRGKILRKAMHLPS
jgi:NAD(P)-dependent dehydrogenase (short-subunit alcohol dehydrogenase family)